jgi:hypothetical protein
MGETESRPVVAPLLAIAAASAAVMISEVALTRLFSVTIWYHFSFVAVSLAMLGMAASAVHVRTLLANGGRARLEAWLPSAALAGGAAMLLGTALYLAIDPRGTFMEDSSSPFRLLPALLFVPVFYAAGTVICGLIALHAGQVNRLYLADLCAAGLGCVATVPLLDLLPGPAVLGAAGLLLACAALFLRPPGPRAAWLTAVALTALAGASVAAWQAGWLDVRHTKEYDEKGLGVIYEKWSALARITVVDKRWFKTDRPYGWGLSRNYAGPPAEEMWLEQDASAGSSLVATDGDLDKLDFLDWDVTAVPYALRQFDRVAVVGLGGGRDALLARRHGAEVWGIEINPDIANLVTARFADYVGRLFGRDRLHVVVADGRTFLEQTDLRFDLIQISLIDSWAASASGAYVMAENNLYTREAFRTYLDRLEDDGVLSVSRWALTQTPGECIRLVALALQALKERGIPDPAANIAVVRGELVGTVLVKKTPFAPADVQRLSAHCDRMAFEPLLLPGAEGGLLSVKLVADHAADLDGFLALLPYDFSPPTDDRPFFFLMLRPLQSLLSPFTWDTGLRQNFVAVRTLYVLLAVLAVVLALVVLLPAWRLGSAGRGLGRWRLSLLFAAMGLGYMLVEIPLVQKLVPVLGHPIYALTVVLAALLVFSGIGAGLSARLVTRKSRPDRRLLGAVLLLAVVVALSFPLVGRCSSALLGLPFGLRLLILIPLIGLAGILMGLPFPSAVALCEKRGASPLLPWLWAVNGAAGVLGSVLAFALALLSGFTVASRVGILCYVAAALLFRRISLEGEGEPE